MLEEEWSIIRGKIRWAKYVPLLTIEVQVCRKKSNSEKKISRMTTRSGWVALLPSTSKKIHRTFGIGVRGGNSIKCVKNQV